MDKVFGAAERLPAAFQDQPCPWFSVFWTICCARSSSGRRTGLHEDRNVSVVAVMGELGVIAEADSVFLSSGSRRCPIPGEVELIALYGDADALQIIQIRKAQAVRLGRDEHFDIALDGIVVRVGEQAVQRVPVGSSEEVDVTAAGMAMP